MDYGRSTAFGVSLEGVTETDAGIHKFCATIAIARTRRATHIFYEAVCIARLPRTTRSKTNDLNTLPYLALVCESALAVEVVRNDRYSPSRALAGYCTSCHSGRPSAACSLIHS